MDLIPTAIPDVVSLVPTRHQDDQGSFSETFRAEWFPGLTFVQDNHSYSSDPGTIRGCTTNFLPPTRRNSCGLPEGGFATLRSIFAAARPPTWPTSPSSSSAEGGEQVLVPSGFAHGFVTLEPDTVVLYKVTSYYSRELERGIPWNEPALAVEWGIDSEPVLSQRDRSHPHFDPTEPPFRLGDR